MADTDPEKLWVIPEDAWNQITGVWGVSQDRVGITRRFKRWWLKHWTWDDGWTPKRKEENGTNQGG